MNKKLLSILFICGIMLLGGCSLAKEEAVSRESDRLVGVYLTIGEPNGDGQNEHWVE